MFKLHPERIGEQKIDSGSFGAVFPYQRDPEDLKWVVKRIHANDTDEVLKSFPEIVIGFSCDHPCIVPLKGYHIERGLVRDYYVYLKFPRMKKSLEDRFKEQESTGNPFSEQEIVEYFYSLVCAVDYLHAKKIYHRDIKPDNILLDHQGKAKLCDIGLAKYVGEEEAYQKLSGKDGALMYTAPELLKDRETLTKESLRANDVWSVGLVILQLCLLTKSPFGIYPVPKKILNVQKNLKRKYADKLVDLIFGLLKLDPNERMKIADVKKKLEEEYRYCKIFEGDSEKDGDNLVKESKRRLEEKYQEAAQEMMVLVEALKQENLKLQNELKEYQFSVKKLQFQISDMSKHYNETVERLEVQNASLASEIVQKKTQELEKIAKVPSPKIENTLRVSVIGSNVSGKSAFCTRLMGRSRENDDFKRKLMTQSGTVFDISLREIDFEGFKEIRRVSFEVLISLYDITNDNSFSNLQLQISLISDIRVKRPIVFLIGTKLDLESQRQVAKLEAEKYAEEIGGIHFEVSSKTGENFLEFQQELTALLAKHWPPEKVRVIEEKKKSSFWGLFR